ncbi:acyl-CoA thioesterase, partial [Azotobacter chroococcum]|nr:acyl-CoA thioesterase [Azotobacter chroococcum]
NRKPTQVPPLQPTTEQEKRRYEQAKRRRELRQELEARYRQIKNKAS